MEENNTGTTIFTLKGHIKTGNFNPFYIFTGEEVKIMDIYIDMIAKKSKLSIERSDSLSEVYQKIKAKTLIQQSFLYIIRDDKDFMMNDKLWSKFDERVNDNIVIFYYTDIDKRTKFWKHFGTDIIVFEPLTKPMLVKYIQKEIDLSDKWCEQLVDICEHSYGRILLEIDKIKQYQEGTTTYDHSDKEFICTKDCFRDLVNDGTIHVSPHDAVFDFASAVLNRDTKEAFSLLRESYEVGEANMVLLSVLYNSAKQLLQLQSCIKENRNPVETAGLNGFQIKTVKPFVNKYKNGELVRMMKFIRKCERGIKTGEIPEDISMQYVLVNCM